MLSALAQLPLKAAAYSSQPFSLLDAPAHDDLAAILEIDLLENGSREARECWQERQLANLLAHARARSPYWRRRIPPGPVTRQSLGTLAIQTRADVMEQVNSEGSLLGAQSGKGNESYASSGSTGTPVKVHVAGFNGRYNAMRSLAQYFMERRPLNEPRTFIQPASAAVMLDPCAKLKVERHKTWIGRFSPVFEDAPHKIIEFAQDEHALLAELRKDRVGYLACPSTFMTMILRAGGPDELRRLGIAIWLHHSDNLDAGLAAEIRGLGIPIRSSYSCSEAGGIASECAAAPGFHHVVHSNVIVECDRSETVQIGGEELGRILLTHLHSYATPLIRYDVGDFGKLDGNCRCGHDGPTLSALHGRGKFFLRHPDGRLLPFYVFSARLFEIAKFTEFRIHQPDVMTITVELGGRDSLTPAEEDHLRAFVTRASDPVFDVRIKVSPVINWVGNPKRLAFTSAVA